MSSNQVAGAAQLTSFADISRLSAAAHRETEQPMTAVTECRRVRAKAYVTIHVSVQQPETNVAASANRYR